MVTLTSTTYAARTGQSFNTTDWPTQSDVSNWCTHADEIIEGAAGTTLTNARTTNALVAIAVLVTRRIQKDAERERWEGSAETPQATEPLRIVTREIQDMINKCFEPDGIPFGTFKLVKDRTD